MDDESLRARFRSLAAAEARGAPHVTAETLARHRQVVRARRSSRALRLTGATAALAAAAAALVVAWPRPTPTPLDLAAFTWTAPSDFLLDTPGSAFLRTVPTISLPQPTIVTESADRDDTSRRNQ